MTAFLDPRKGPFNPTRLRQVNGRFTYIEDCPVSALCGAPRVDPAAAYHAGLALRDITAHLGKRVAFFGGKLDLLTELRRIVEQPLMPSAPVQSETAYCQALLGCVLELLDGIEA